MKRSLLWSCLVVALAGCASTKSSIQVETNLSQALLDSSEPQGELTARICIESR